MARWKLTSPHYLKIQGSTWEYKELDRTTGKQIRKVYEVPALLDPDAPGDWNYKLSDGEGEIIVSNGGTSEPKDIIFVGQPTPDMLPLDDEAKAISATFEGKWNHPIESLDGNFSKTLLSGLQEQMATAASAQKAVQVDGMEQLLAAMTMVMKQQGDLIAALAPAQRRA